jgi:hypothetical protein
MIRLLVKIVFVNLFAITVFFFAVATVQIGGIHSTGLSDAELIRARNRVRLVFTGLGFAQGRFV